MVQGEVVTLKMRKFIQEIGVQTHVHKHFSRNTLYISYNEMRIEDEDF